MVTGPSGAWSSLEDGIEIIVPGADQDRTCKIEGHRISSLDEKVLAGAHVLQGLSDASAADDDGRNNLSGGVDGGGHCGDFEFGGKCECGARNCEGEKSGHLEWKSKGKRKRKRVRVWWATWVFRYRNLGITDW